MFVTAIAFGTILFTVMFLLIAVYQRSTAVQVIFAIVTVAQGVFIIWAYCYYDEEIKNALLVTIRRRNPTQGESFAPKFQSANWSNAKLQEDTTSENQNGGPTRFLDDSKRTAPLTHRYFNPDSIPLTDLEKQRMSKVIVNGDAVKEAVLVTHHEGGRAEVNGGFSITDVNGVVVTGPDSNGNAIVVLHETETHNGEAESKV